ncbi:MAG: dGTPase [Oscillospiraceae bacterium]|nr:dGTPase [Oscillospiraceae bacterium]
MAQKNDYKQLYSTYRVHRKSNAGRGDEKSEEKIGERIIDAFYSDRSRILYCSAFRRLQQKAQVFSMETNSNVRSRLTHSLEVADLGRRLADRIAFGLKKEGYFTDITIPVAVSIVENACLLHDIGNPPFGHFGESAIQDWAKNRAMDAAPADWTQIREGKREWLPHIGKRMKDFEQFDGNPQGFRTVSKLFTDFGDAGLNLTCATLLCGLKYARTTCEEKDDGIKKKAGFFQTEEALVDTLMAQVERSRGTRYPLTYIMEAADDIAYCMSDIADGIEKRILTEEEFVQAFVVQWEKDYPAVPQPWEIRRFLPPQEGGDGPAKMVGFNRDFAIYWSDEATREAVQIYIDNHQQILAGTAPGLFSEERYMGKVLRTVNKVCQKLLYPSIEAESIELTGYAVIAGILRHYERLLKLSAADFLRLTQGDSKGLAVERRLYNRFSKGCVDAYTFAVEKLDRDRADFAMEEWWLRVHLLIDHISAMTDAFALETYQMLEGIALMRT